MSSIAEKTAMFPWCSGERPDRRRTRRVATFRSAVFSPYDDSGLERVGVAVNIGTAGVCIHTDCPETVGAVVQLCLEPRPDDARSQAISVQGRVTYVTESPEYGASMGVRFDLAPLLSRRLQGKALSKALSQAPDAPTAGDCTELPVSRVSKARTWAMALGVALAILLLVLLMPVDFRAPSRAAHKAHAGNWRRAPVAEGKEPPAEPQRSLLSTTPALSDTPPAARAPEEGWAAANLAASTPPEPFSALLPATQAAVGAGDGTASPDSMDHVPPAWQLPAFPFDEEVRAKDSAEIVKAALTDALEVEAALRNEKADLVLVIRKEAHELVVVREGQPRAVFPVGLGFADRTPLGWFRIANKIAQPNWFNRGNVVRAGDPRNPLGASWMGLGTERGPTPYGLHPTRDAASIGHDRSRGCIRLHPRDAETLFRLCPLGTPVWICESHGSRTTDRRHGVPTSSGPRHSMAGVL